MRILVTGLAETLEDLVVIWVQPLPPSLAPLVPGGVVLLAEPFHFSDEVRYALPAVQVGPKVPADQYEVLPLLLPADDRIELLIEEPGVFQTRLHVRRSGHRHEYPLALATKAVIRAVAFRRQTGV